MSPAVWFITGASSGMGLTMTKLVLSQGDIAIATLRKPEVLADLKEQYPADRLLLLKLDVSKQSEIKDAFNKSQEVFGRIDVVFSNAGFGMLGEVEGTPDEMARAIFETNFWGALNVAREAVRFFREVNNPIGGRLITTSSMLGIVAGAALGFYAASKHALEGALESFSKELDPKWNIKMTMVEPGGFATRGAKPESLVQTPVHPAYTDPKSTVQYIRGYLPNVALPGDTEKAMKVIYHTIAKSENPPLRLPLGQDALKGFRAQAKAYADDADKWASLSDDLLLDGKEVLTHLD